MKLYRFCIMLLVGVSMLITPSCDLVETNIDPTAINDAPLNLVLPSAIAHTTRNQSSNQARVPAIIMQQFIGTDAQQLAYTDYIIPQNTFNNYWITGLYAGALKDCIVIIEKAQAEGQPYYEGIAKILMAENYGMAASFFGDIPFSDALKGIEVLQPSYDTQESIYAGVQSMLDDAISLLSQTAVPGGPGGDDLIFGGDAALWIQTARALKARYYMHLTKRDAANANNALAQLRLGSIGSLSDQPNFAWSSQQTGGNPLALFGIERTNTINVDPSLAQRMTDRMDPRQSSYMVNDGSSWQFYVGGNTDLVWAQLNSAIPLISYVEVKFMEAEALLWTGASDADVSAALTEAITASMEQVGIAAADYEAYVTANGTVSGGTSEKLEKIIEEAYYAYYGYAFQQVWTNYRRTGFPALTPAAGGSSGINPSGGIPRRFLYVDSEVTTNLDNYNAAASRIGGDLLDTDTWAFQ